jgi:ketosteroid isomerase-like protein
MSLPEIHLVGDRREVVKLTSIAEAIREAGLLAPVLVVGGRHPAAMTVPPEVTADVTLELTADTDREAAPLADMISRLDQHFGERPPAAVIVHGDTMTGLAGALAAFWRRIPVVHFEAGVRSGDLGSPLPDEANRRLVAQVAALHLAPTALAAMNLLDEHIAADDVLVIGSTVGDATLAAAARKLPFSDAAIAAARTTAGDRRKVLVTGRPDEPQARAQAGNGIDKAVRFYADAWINGDRAAVRRMIAPDAEIDWNLDEPVDDEELVQTLHRMATFADSVTVVSQNYSDERAVVIYDCAAPFGTARIVEFLTVVDGRITEVRQVHDAVAVRRFFPGLLEYPGSPDPFEPPD